VAVGGQVSQTLTEIVQQVAGGVVVGGDGAQALPNIQHGSTTGTVSAVTYGTAPGVIRRGAITDDDLLRKSATSTSRLLRKSAATTPTTIRRVT
jgi:hypothetical protein